ncbi:hypothetical protein [Candidatus Protochlamydia phocaeensis]|uniref:hypothetical protein n=1 Tax=Candidatus Protochlamydia phocaeensis TaxID=1414722 RepID=UPI0008384498|nr:hypothetical protein [Candidatus Protochlamydia phocaeensis]
MISLRLFIPTTVSCFDYLKSSYDNSLFIVEDSDHLLLKTAKHIGNISKKTVILLSLAITSVVAPLFAVIECAAREIGHLAHRVRGAMESKRTRQTSQQIASFSPTRSSPIKEETPSSVEKAAPTESMVSYTFSGGFIGDNLITYLHAKWLSYKYNIPLAFQPFEFSNELVLSDVEKEYEVAKFKKSEKHVNEEPFTQLSQKSLEERREEKELHSICYFPESPSERGPNYRGAYVEVDWSDAGFKNLIKDLIKPKQALSLVTPPKDRTSIAVHWRRGATRLDGPTTQNYYPCKVPPDEYYISQLLNVCQIYADQPLYIHLFTDDKEPALLQQKLKDKIREAGYTQDIIFGVTEPKEGENPVLRDLFSMAHGGFNCLIRSESHFSIMAQLIGEHDLVIGPKHFHSEINYGLGKTDIVIDQLAIFEKGIEREEKAEIRFPYILRSPIEKYLWHHVDVFGLLKLFP